MTTYSKRDIRAADILAMVLVGTGSLLAALATVCLTGVLGSAPEMGKGVGGATVGLCIAAVVFLALGAALQLKIKQLIRSGCREPDDYEGVPK